MDNDSHSSRYCWSISFDLSSPASGAPLHQALNQELAHLDSIDNIVDSMQAYPDITTLLERLK